MRVAAIQLNSTDEYDRNLEVAEQLVRDAAADGAELVALPEKWTFLGPPEGIADAAEPLSGPAITAAATWASELGIHLLAGSARVQRSSRRNEEVRDVQKRVGQYSEAQSG